MKYLMSVSFIVLMLSLQSAHAQPKIITAHLKVYGNCVMCKIRIEKTLDHSGIKKAVWSPVTKDLEVVYNNSKISELEICELLSAAGHDTDKTKATLENYASLPFCCLYRDSDGGKTHGSKGN